jgi:effector-binding domain-containing protein
MAKITRRGFIQYVGFILVASACLLWSGNCTGKPLPKKIKQAPAEPRLEHRDKQHYVAIQTTAAIKELPTVIPKLHHEVYSWLAKQGVKPSGPPFIKYLIIDMERQLTIELGVPVAKPLHGNGRVRPGVFPAGRYANLTYMGPYDGLVRATADILAWAERKKITWQTRQTRDGELWVSRSEFYITDPKNEPDPKRWKTEIVFLTAENKTR